MKFEDQVEEATTFDPSEAPDGERLDGSETHRTRYERLADANTLRWNGAWRDEKQATDRDHTAILDSVASCLDLTGLQRRRAGEYLDYLPEEYRTKRSTAVVMTAICMISANEDGRDYHPNMVHPNSSAENELRDIQESIGFSYRLLFSTWNDVKEEL